MKTKRQPNKQQPTSTSPRRFYRNFLTQASVAEALSGVNVYFLHNLIQLSLSYIAEAEVFG